MHEYALEPVTAAPWFLPGDHARLYAGDDLMVVELHGEIDLATALELRPWLDSVATMGAPVYVVDLRTTSFIDSAGLSMVLRFRRRVADVDASFALVCAQRTLRLLRAYGAFDLLNPATTLHEAITRAATSGA